MENFSQLLNQYIQRLGLSDAELARTIGVSRQTIFRWREGATARPRHREDVLALARKLRLAPEERDRLLLTAGFRPEETQQQDNLDLDDLTNRESGEQESKEAKEPSNTQSEKELKSALVITPTSIEPEWYSARSLDHPKESQIKIFTPPNLKRALAIIISISFLVGGGLWWTTQKPIDPTITKTPIMPAATGETLVLVTHFANYASSQVSYNVAGRLVEALQQEVDDTHLQNIRIAVWSKPVGERNLALQTGQEMSATLVIYGEYDVGRVVVKMAHPADQSMLVDPAVQRYVADLQDLSATINSDLPQQVRSLALLALGQIYLRQSNTNEARRLLELARDNIQDDTTVDDKTWGLVNFHLGIAYQHSDPPNLDGAIEAYNKAINAWPAMISSRLNRAAAYEARKQPGDLQRALEDTEAVIAITPNWAPGYNNRASIRLNIGGADNLELALLDLDKALKLKPDLPEAYINQAYIYFRQGVPIEEVVPTLEKALDLRPGYGSALNSLCWGYALEQQPNIALPYCQQAVNAEPAKATFQDSRGIVYALLGNYSAAIADFEAYIIWLKGQQPGITWKNDVAHRQVWIDALKREENPFTPEVLAELREGFGE